MTVDASAWDARYAAAPQVWSAGPNTLFAEIVADWPAGSAVDVGCGEGRTALWLAGRGWQVRAVDFSATGIDKGRARAGSEGLEVDWVVDDVGTADLGAGHDLAALLYLHLPHQQQALVVRRALAALAPAGRLVVIGHAAANLTHGVGGPQDPAVLPTVALLREWSGPHHVERCEQVERVTAEGTALDVVLVVRAVGPGAS